MRTVVVLVMVGLTAGCANPSHLLFHQSTVIGVDVATTADTGTIHAKLGYDRQTATIIPKTKVKATSGSQEEDEAMSVIARSRFKIRWLRASEICERFATGEAARNMARQGAAAALAARTSGTGGCEDW